MGAIVISVFVSLVACIGGLYYVIQDRKEQHGY